jgi:hypothetical protein
MRGSGWHWTLAALIALTVGAAGGEAAAAPGHYRNFRAAIYVAVDATRRLANPATREREFQRVMGQVKFDKVYVEVYRDRKFATDQEIEATKAFFRSKGIEVSGGVTLAAGGRNGQFGTFDYEDPADRAECRRAAELAARHFDEVILDDFFFYTSKSDADIAAKGAQSWTQYRLETMRKAASDLVLGPARTVNPKVRMIIKYPNWYEHFQGLGFDLGQEAQAFDAIYTGTETRDPEITDQLLQQYESYLIFRYFTHIRPDGADLGGWVDTYGDRYADRYAEQLWDTLLAKAPEITLFNWTDLAAEQPVPAGDRDAWKGQGASLDWDEMVRTYEAGGASDPGPGWASVAGYALEKIDPVLGRLGRPVGLMSYKPVQSSGEDFLQDYLGNIGLPIELTSRFPTEAPSVLLTEAAKFDPDIVSRIKTQLQAGKTVVITSGLLKALQDKGIEDIVEIWPTGHVAAVHDFISGFGAGAGQSLNDPAHDTPAILFPELHFWTNDAWPVVRGVAGAKGFPILLMDSYSKGTLFVLAVPENIGDLYGLPQPAISQLKRYLDPGANVRIDAPAKVALFAYDNGAFVIQSYRPTEAVVNVSIAGEGRRLTDLQTGATVPAAAALAAEPGRSQFQVRIRPHAFQGYSAAP